MESAVVERLSVKNLFVSDEPPVKIKINN